MAGISLRDISKRFGETDVLRGINLEIRDSEFVAFVGPSGCGKSTLLRTIAGFETPTTGEVWIAGQAVNHKRPGERGVAMVFQSYALYPHMTVAQNIGFGLTNLGLPRDEVRRRITEVAELLQIDSLLTRRPEQISGGQRQRVAIGRAIVQDPRVFLFDEPLSNLDASLRVQMRIELAKLHQRYSAPMIYVTHDQVEAITLADRIVVMNQGKVEQVGAPMELYHRPANVFVAGFLGAPPMNLLQGELLSASAYRATVRLKDGATLAADVDARDLPGGASVTIGIRPEHLQLEPSRKDGDLTGRLVLIENLGSRELVYLDSRSGERVVAERTPSPDRLPPGDWLALRIDPSRVHLFGPHGHALPPAGKDANAQGAHKAS